MRILLTNDDGIYAPGLMALYQELKNDFEVDIVAPELEMSAASHSITIRYPLKVQKMEVNGSFFGYGVTGSPADCVKIALMELLEKKPDIIISGINPGANLGINVLYSGTVAGALEGAYLGIRSAAISVSEKEKPDFKYAAQFSRKVIKLLKEDVIPSTTALNVNIPSIPAKDIKGVSFVKQGTGRPEEGYEKRSDPRGDNYFWLSGETPMQGDHTADSDAMALRENNITITPIHADFTRV